MTLLVLCPVNTECEGRCGNATAFLKGTGAGLYVSRSSTKSLKRSVQTHIVIPLQSALCTAQSHPLSSAFSEKRGVTFFPHYGPLNSQPRSQKSRIQDMYEEHRDLVNGENM